MNGLTLKNLSYPVQIVGVLIGGWLWVTTFFMTRVDANEAHEHIGKSVERVTILWEIAEVHSDLDFIEKDGISKEEKRDHERLKFKLEFLIKKSLGLGK